MEHHTEGKWFIHAPKHRHDNQLQSLKNPADYPKFSM